MKKHDDSTSGQSLLEFADDPAARPGALARRRRSGYALLDQHVVTKLAREGSNLISRNTTLAAAGDVMLSMGTRPVNFAAGGGSKLILSVIKMGAVEPPNAELRHPSYQRYEVGNLAKASTADECGQFRGLFRSGLHGAECRQQYQSPSDGGIPGESGRGGRVLLHHRDLDQAPADHAVRPFRRHRAAVPLFDRAFLNRR